MKEPMVSIFWLNYNSSVFMNVALESLQRVVDLNYSNFELIVVDNNSTDGSFKVIKSFLEKKSSDVRVKIIGLTRNIGFTGGNNVAYRAMEKESKYIVLLNNDVVISSNSLKELVELIEGDDSIGSLAGITMKYDGRTVENAGIYMSELFSTFTISALPSGTKKFRYITYATGAYSIHRISSVKRAVGSNSFIFDETMFAYYDDNVLGLKMWGANFKVASFPIIAAKHIGSASFGRNKSLLAYLEARSLAAINEISNSRYKGLVKPLLINTVYAGMTQAALDRTAGLFGKETDRKSSIAYIRGFNDGIRIGRSKRALGESINLYKAPIVGVDYRNFSLICMRPWFGFMGRVRKKIIQSTLGSL